MTNMLGASLPGFVRAHPHVAGHTRRFKAAPAKLNRLALQIMCASGAFSAERAAARLRPGRFLGAVAFLLAAGTLAIAGDAHQIDERAWIASALSAQPDSLFTLGVDDYHPPAVVEVSPDRDGQDQFEIARLYRKSAATSKKEERRSNLNRAAAIAAR